jgi:hypothetical protein
VAVISSEPGRDKDARPAATDVADVLRGVWTASGQTSADLDELFGPARSCKSMQHVGFDGFADAGGDLRSAWRATLEREGKLTEQRGTVRDLVLGQDDRGDR